LGGSHSLLAADILALPLRGMKLVVMSACESAELQHRISNEIYGFPWVLLAAGAENVVTSRWLVNGGSNSRWMRSFYAAVAGGASPAEALATAMRTMLKEDRSKPYYWAAMQVSGR
jgi:CHAT domain-containing protein